MELAYTKARHERGPKSEESPSPTARRPSIVSSREVRWGRRFNREETLTPERAVPLDAEAAKGMLPAIALFSSFKPLKKAVQYIHEANTNQ